MFKVRHRSLLMEFQLKECRLVFLSICWSGDKDVQWMPQLQALSLVHVLCVVHDSLPC